MFFTMESVFASSESMKYACASAPSLRMSSAFSSPLSLPSELAIANTMNFPFFPSPRSKYRWMSSGGCGPPPTMKRYPRGWTADCACAPALASAMHRSAAPVFIVVPEIRIFD